MPSKTTESPSPKNEAHQASAKVTYSIKQVAERLSLHRSTILRLLHDGQLGYCRVGTRMLIPAENLQSFVNELKQQKTVTEAVH